MSSKPTADDRPGALTIEGVGDYRAVASRLMRPGRGAGTSMSEQSEAIHRGSDQGDPALSGSPESGRRGDLYPAVARRGCAVTERAEIGDTDRTGAVWNLTDSRSMDTTQTLTKRPRNGSAKTAIIGVLLRRGRPVEVTAMRKLRRGYLYRHPLFVGALALGLVASGVGLELASPTGAQPPSFQVLTSGFSGPFAVSSDGSHVWVANNGNESVTELDASTGALIHELSGPSYNFGFADGIDEAGAISSDGVHVWTANPRTNSVTELDASTGALVHVLSGSSYGFSGPINLSSDGTHVWVAKLDQQLRHRDRRRHRSACAGLLRPVIRIPSTRCDRVRRHPRVGAERDPFRRDGLDAVHHH